MENLSDMYYLLRFIADRIFVYLRDMILHEFPGISDEINEHDPSGTKIRAHLFTKRAIADIVAFLTICVCFGSFVLLSGKCAKDSDDPHDSPPRPVSAETEGETMELLEDEDYTITHSTLENTRQNPWGDATVVGPDFASNFTRRKPAPRNRRRIHCFPKNRQSTSSIVELRASHSHHSQSTQTNQKTILLASKNRDWLIRRTRSGHIYGKYPL